MSDQLPSREEAVAVWPFTWCEVHFAGAVEKMAGCLVWVERGMAGAPDCKLVDRLLVDREVIDYEAAKEQVRIWLTSVDIDDEPLAHSMSIAAVDAAIGDTDDA